MAAELLHATIRLGVTVVEPAWKRASYERRSDDVATKTQFTLKAMLGCMAALCVAVAILPACDEFVALYYMPMVVGGCVGYLLKGWRGLCVGVLLGVFAFLIIGIPAYLAWLVFVWS